MFDKCLYVRKYEGLDSLKRTYILRPKNKNVSLATLCLNDPRMIISLISNFQLKTFEMNVQSF